jgi:hypothetical protein
MGKEVIGYVNDQDLFLKETIDQKKTTIDELKKLSQYSEKNKTSVDLLDWFNRSPLADKFNVRSDLSNSETLTLRRKNDVDFPYEALNIGVNKEAGTANVFLYDVASSNKNFGLSNYEVNCNISIGSLDQFIEKIISNAERIQSFQKDLSDVFSHNLSDIFNEKVGNYEDFVFILPKFNPNHSEISSELNNSKLLQNVVIAGKDIGQLQFDLESGKINTYFWDQQGRLNLFQTFNYEINTQLINSAINDLSKKWTDQNSGEIEKISLAINEVNWFKEFFAGYARGYSYFSGNDNDRENDIINLLRMGKTIKKSFTDSSYGIIMGTIALSVENGLKLDVPLLDELGLEFSVIPVPSNTVSFVDGLAVIIHDLSLKYSEKPNDKKLKVELKEKIIIEFSDIIEIK